MPYDWTPRFLAAAGSNAKHLCLYGNHDAWPGAFPLLAPASMQTHRDHLRQTWMLDTWPTAPLIAPLSTGGEVQLYALNSVDHDLSANVRALGKVLPDRFWDLPNAKPGPTAIDDLTRAIAAHRPVSPKCFRILAMHYPVCRDANAGKRFSEILTNRDDVAAEIASAARKAGAPPVQLLLAGHTHLAFPLCGLFPNGLGAVWHKPLPSAVSQCVTPSLSQLVVGQRSKPSDFYPDRLAEDYPYQCTVLRLYAGTQPDELIVERTLAGCAPGGYFAPLPVSEGSSRSAEQMAVSLA